MIPNTTSKAEASVCGFCGISKLEKKLSVCAGCRSAQYCSPECQKNAWKDHKVWCKHNRELITSLRAMAPKSSIDPPDNHYSFLGLNPADSFAILRKWCHHHRPILTWAFHNALEIKSHPERGETDVFLVCLQLSPSAHRASSKSQWKLEQVKPSKMFRVQDAFAISKRDLAFLWPKIGEGIAKADEEHAKMDRKDRMKEEVSIMLARCGAHVNLMPCFWNMAELAELEEKTDWKAALISQTGGLKDGK